MSRNRKSSIAAAEPFLQAFDQQVEAALKHIDDPLWLGTNSPLSTPYVLGRNLLTAEAGDTPIHRGTVLQQLIQRLAEELEPEAFTILKTTYLQRKPRHDSTDLAIALHQSRRTFYRNRNLAIQALAALLNRQLQPSLRSEAPIERQLFERERDLHTAFHALASGRSLYLYGASGIGKTSLAAKISTLWAAQLPDPNSIQSTGNIQSKALRTFWYTIRPAFNDQAASLVLALAFFLRELGASHTWRQLVADNGIIQSERILGTIRYDLSLLTAKPLLCIDEVDTLQPDVIEHAKVFHLIEELRFLTPLLLIGQRVLVETDEQLKVEGLTEQGLAKLFLQADVAQPTIAQAQKLLTLTRGNPTLLLLIVSLVRSGDEIEDILLGLSGKSVLEALFARIWRRLSELERLLLMRLVVYNAPAPSDVFSDQAGVLQQLSQRELLEWHTDGSILVQSHIQSLVYQQISSDLLATLHLQAMSVRIERSQIIFAMYHALKAEQPSQAVWFWFNNRHFEVEHGQGIAALHLLDTILAEDLVNERDRIALRVSRAELQQLLGQADKAELELKNLDTKGKIPITAYVAQLQADVLLRQDRLQQALQKYREGLDTLWGAPEQRASILHAKLSYLYSARLQDMSNARREALRARAEADIRHGRVEERSGNLTLARERFESAVTLAEEINNDLNILGRAYSQLGKLYLKTGDVAKAVELMQQSNKCDKQRGDIVGPLYDAVNLSYAYSLMKDFDQALQHGQEALLVADTMRNSHLIAGLTAAVAEAHCGLGQYSESETFAHRSLQQEDDFFRPWALTILGVIHGKQRQMDEGVKYFHAAIQAAQEIEDKYGAAYAWRKLGDVHADHSQREQAHSAYNTALRLYRELGLDHEIKQIEQALDQLTLPGQ